MTDATTGDSKTYRLMSKLGELLEDERERQEGER